MYILYIYALYVKLIIVCWNDRTCTSDLLKRGSHYHTEYMDVYLILRTLKSIPESNVPPLLIKICAVFFHCKSCWDGEQ